MSQFGCNKFYRCQCFMLRNYYSAEYNVHLEYSGDDDKFLKDIAELFHEQACDTEERKKRLLNDVKSEYHRRLALDTESLERKKKISLTYLPLHKEVYFLKDEFFHEDFKKITKHSKANNSTHSSLMNFLQREEAEEVYRIPVFTVAFCQLLIEELQYFEQSELPKGRPNTMNNGGILLDEIGFYENFITPFREKYLNPIASILFSDWVGKCLDSHKAFTVKYKEGEDKDLGYHYDNAEVTMNICLGKKFEDGSLYFGGMRQKSGRLKRYWEVKHSIGEGVLHRGQHMHGAMPISSGERINLIIWMRSSSVRNKMCPMCDSEPVLTAANQFGDGFTKEEPNEVEVCLLT